MNLIIEFICKFISVFLKKSELIRLLVIEFNLCN